ncbi:MAG: V-type ATP synthase subunit F [Candidatus Lokiarchaeota archaeon]|nr:V-type ATP synthase subunit F [Candidatus Lokiarchaeota archaeon]
MPDEKIHVIGYDEIVSLFGLLGIEGTAVDNKEEFIKIFENLIKRSSIAMIIINMELPDELLEYIMDFKTNNRIPFVYLLPDIFQPDIKNRDKIFDKIHELIADII